MNRSRLRLFAAVFAALFPAAAPAQEIAHLAPQFFISHSLGNFPNIPYVWPLDPLVYPNTFFVVGRGVSNDLPLDVRAVNFRGSVSLAAYPIVATAGAAWPRLEVIPSRVRLYGRFPEEGVDFHILAKPAPPYEAILEPSSFARPVPRESRRSQRTASPDRSIWQSWQMEGLAGFGRPTRWPARPRASPSLLRSVPRSRKWLWRGIAAPALIDRPPPDHLCEPAIFASRPSLRAGHLCEPD